MYSSNDIEHGLLGTTTKRKNAKYIAKIPIGNGKYRYFYSHKELKAYQMLNKVKKSIDGVGNKIIDASGRKYYKKAANMDKEIKSKEQKMKKAEADYAKLENKAKLKGRKIGVNEAYTKKEKKAYDEALKRKQETGFDYSNAKYKKEHYNRKGDKSLYGTLKSVKKDIDYSVKEAKKNVKKTKDNIKKEVNKNTKNIKKELKDLYKESGIQKYVKEFKRKKKKLAKR